MQRKFILLFGIAALVAASAALADSFAPFLKHSRYNPNQANITLASHDLGGTGEPGTLERKGFVLVVDPTTAANGASADLTVKNETFAAGNKITLTELGFDIFTPGGFNTFDRGSLCGAGLRFDFENSSTGGVYSLNCNQGVHTDRGNGWTRVRYTSANDADVVTLAGPAWPGFGTARVDFIQLLNDGGAGGGVDILDNVDYNGHLIVS
jgi:hypothetical protein